MDGWKHFNKWTKRGDGFTVEVVNYQDKPISFNINDGGHRWNVYAYIYPTHPYFGKFDGDNLFQDAAIALPLHMGPSYLQWHLGLDGKVKCIQVGSDYNHLHDDYYTECEDAISCVMDDAVKLFDWLSNKASEGAEHV